MGGILSGNHGGRATVEACPSLDLYKLLRLDPGAEEPAGTRRWRDPITGAPTLTVAYRIVLGAGCGEAHLICNAGGSDRALPIREQHVSLAAISQPFGGERWWFVCHVTGGHVSKLYLPRGSVRFASRAAHRLGYRSQRETPQARNRTRVFKRQARLGEVTGIGFMPAKPKGMHWATYEREAARIAADEAACQMDAQLMLARLNRRSLPMADVIRQASTANPGVICGD